MKRIHKQIVRMGEFQYRLPYKSRIVHFGVDVNHSLCMWYEFRDPSPGTNTVVKQIRTFRVFGTGHTVPDNSEYLHTTIVGQYVWHLYEILP